MKKIRISSAIAVFLAALFLVSCEKETSFSVKEAIDYNGNKYSVLTDEDGFLSLAEKSGLAVIVEDSKGKMSKNSNGEFVTKSEDFPETLTVENEIHTKFFKIPIPDGWENKSREAVVLEYSDEEHSAEIMINERSTDTPDECIAEIEKLISSSNDMEKESVNLSFSTAVKLKYKQMFVFYVFSAEERTYFVRVTADEALFEKINFEDIINTIKFRKGE